MVNRVILIGNLGSDPEVRNTTTGKQVASFNLATSEKFKDKHSGETRVDTQWHNVVLWGNLATVAGTYLKKGSKVYLEGKIKYRSYDANGTKKFITEIVGDTMQMLGERPQPAKEVMESSGHLTAQNGADGADDLPF